MSRLENPRPSDFAFTFYWNLLEERLRSSKGVPKPEDILKLKVLCDFFKQYEDLRDIISIAGYTTTNGGGRNGEVERLRPEVQQMNKAAEIIKAYSKDLFGEIIYEPDEPNEFD